jgi:hypothetical protein
MEAEGLPHCQAIQGKKTRGWHDKQIKIEHFKQGHKVLLFNSCVCLFGHGKLHSKRESLYLVLHVTDHGVVTSRAMTGIHLRRTINASNYSLSQPPPPPQDFEEVDALNFLEIE